MFETDLEAEDNCNFPEDSFYIFILARLSTLQTRCTRLHKLENM